jgi:hypothetical protein
MADHGEFPPHNLHPQLPIARAQVQPSTWSKLIAKVVAQEEKYWAEAAQLDEDDCEENSAEEEWAAD